MDEKLHIVCPHCRSINRVPLRRVTDQPHCGQCHARLFTGHPIGLTSADFDVHASRSDIPLLVDFWAPWCGPCRMMGPEYEQAAQVLEPQVRLGKVNTEEQQALASRYRVVSIPTLMLFKQGREVARQAGALDQLAIVRWVRTHL